jgi:sphingolipid 4-desaturase/C4-monooxygenase
MRSSVATATIPPRKPVRTTLKAPPVEAKSVEAESKSAIDNEHDFLWTYTEEPHRTRRQAIIKAHPEVLLPSSYCQHCFAHMCNQVTKLCGPEPLTKYLVAFVVSLQILCAYFLRDTPFLSWKFFLTAYIIGATANQNLFLAIHEISHNLAFKSGLANRVFAVFANLPIGIPYSASFRVSRMTPLNGLES